MALVVTDPDRTQAVPAPGRHRAGHWEDTEGYRPRAPYSPPPPPQRPPAAAPPTPPPGHQPHSPSAPPGRPIYRAEALRRHAEARSAARMPLVISGPSFLLLWILVAAVLAAGATLIALALGAGG
ncbi:hypothetical protein [Streptosporangium amethystogenes]|uniref:hypothetical protein n=1 Tax=Streptosporangium amethystogenes TaxID=2002 RepID=UPI0004C9BF58|nr:hypothetical protein [Streptosporangium amethystogenes]